MKSRSHRRARSFRTGFTIIEVIVIVTIIGIIAAVIAPRLFARIGQSKQTVAKSNASSLASAMKTFMIDHGKPESGSTIMILFERPSGIDEAKWQPYVDNKEALVDPWGKEFVLLIPPQKNVDFDIVSYGADGIPGGTGENADIVVP